MPRPAGDGTATSTLVIPGSTSIIDATWRSLLIAYGLGVLLTLVVVTASAWRVSRLNIIRAIRDLAEHRDVVPEPAGQGGRDPGATTGTPPGVVPSSAPMWAWPWTARSTP